VLAGITAIQNYVVLAWSGRPITAATSIARELVMFGTWALLTPPIAIAASWIRARGRAAHLAHVPLVAAASLSHNALLVLALPLLRATPEAPPFAEQLAAMVGRYFVLDVVFYGAIVLATLAAAWAAAYRRRDADSARLEADLARARLDALRGQLQPHFLFNALHAASALIELDPARARRAIVKLAELLRATLEVRAPVISLAEELALLDGYLELQRIRFGDRLTIALDVPAELHGAAVPPLVLQPLVENAIRHGLGARPEAGAIAIAARVAGARLQLTVADDGVGLAACREERVGLGATRARLATLYAGAAALELAPRPGGGAVATVELPLARAPREGVAR
jgi:hypothetical protein